MEPDIVLNNYSIYENDNNNEANSEVPLPIKDKQVSNTSSKHGIHFQENNNRNTPEKKGLIIRVPVDCDY